jgi:hypothetical protein
MKEYSTATLFLIFIFELAYINNTMGFHCDNFIHEHSTLRTSLPPHWIFIAPPATLFKEKKCSCFFERGSSFVAQATLKLVVFSTLASQVLVFQMCATMTWLQKTFNGKSFTHKWKSFMYNVKWKTETNYVNYNHKCNASKCLQYLSLSLVRIRKLKAPSISKCI